MSISDVSIIDVVEEYLAKKSLDNDRDNTYFHASSWNKCRRKAAYLYHEAHGHLKVDAAAGKIDVRTQRIFDNGHYLHARWNEYFRKCSEWLMGYWCCRKCGYIAGADNFYGVTMPAICEGHTPEYMSCGGTEYDYHEVGFEDKSVLWGGHVDAILDMGFVDPSLLSLPTTDRLIIVDLKSMYDFGFKSLMRPTDDHICQMQVYLSLSGLKEGRFVYEDKDNQKLKEFIVERDDDYIAQQRKEALDLKHIVEHTNSQGRHVLPKRDDMKYMSSANVECKRCQFRAHCWK